MKSWKYIKIEFWTNRTKDHTFKLYFEKCLGFIVQKHHQDSNFKRKSKKKTVSNRKSEKKKNENPRFEKREEVMKWVFGKRGREEKGKRQKQVWNSSRKFSAFELK